MINSKELEVAVFDYRQGRTAFIGEVISFLYFIFELSTLIPLAPWLSVISNKFKLIYLFSILGID